MESVMDQLVERFKIGSTQPEERIANEWPSIIGEHNAKYANPWRLDKGRTLYVHVSNPVVKQELQFGKKIILGRIQKLPGCANVRQIIFRAG